MALGGKHALAKPLTRSTKAGTPYVRPPEVESQLNELLGESAAEQLARAKCTDKGASQFLKDECLVYVVREAWLADDSALYSELSQQLIRRCIRAIQRTLRLLGVAADDLQDVYGDVITEMMTAILDDEGAGDFYQAKFRRALRFLTLKVHARYERQHERLMTENRLYAPRSEEDEEDGSLEEWVRQPGDVAEDAVQLLEIRQALAAIRDPRHQQAFVLHHYDDWPIETQDPLAPSVSGHFEVTPRTVNNWLRAAERDLAEWRAANRA